MSNADDLMGIEHLDHCIDMLRQGIMVSFVAAKPFLLTCAANRRANVLILFLCSVPAT